MITVILTIHVLIVLALIGVVLLQRSEGGALGMGGGGGGGFMTGRGAANALTRTTSALAALFFATSLALAIFADRGESDATLIEELTRSGDDPAPVQPVRPGSTTTDDLLRSLGGGQSDEEAGGDEDPVGVLEAEQPSASDSASPSAPAEEQTSHEPEPKSD